MALAELLLAEFDVEMKKTRATLERLPDDKPDFKPHEKSMPLVKLANHTAELPGFLSRMLTGDFFDVADRSPNPTPPPAGGAERLERFDSSLASAREQLRGASDTKLEEHWKLLAGGRTLFDGTRYHAVRSFFFNHMIHHRAQLGIYLRLNNCPVPSIYGPSADEQA